MSERDEVDDDVSGSRGGRTSRLAPFQGAALHDSPEHVSQTALAAQREFLGASEVVVVANPVSAPSSRPHNSLSALFARELDSDAFKVPDATQRRSRRSEGRWERVGDERANDSIGSGRTRRRRHAAGSVGCRSTQIRWIRTQLDGQAYRCGVDAMLTSPSSPTSRHAFFADPAADPDRHASHVRSIIPL